MTGLHLRAAGLESCFESEAVTTRTCSGNSCVWPAREPAFAKIGDLASKLTLVFSASWCSSSPLWIFLPGG
jgi:hypothetical protein